MASSLAPNSADWDAVGDAFYRKQELYQLSWSITDISAYRIVGAPFAGLVAITLDTTQPVPALGPSVAPTSRPRIYIYSCSGELIHTAIWDHPSKLVSFGFTSSEALVAVSSSGFYRLYPISGPSNSGSADLPLYTQYSLGSSTDEVGVLDAVVWPDGMVVMRSDLTFLTIRGWPDSYLLPVGPPSDWNLSSGVANNDHFVLTSLLRSEGCVNDQDQWGGRMESIDSSGLSEEPSAWAVIPPHSSPTGQVQILASRQDSIVVIDSMDCTDQRLVSKGPFQRIVPSPNGKFLALLTGAASPNPYTVWVVSSDFSRELSEFSLEKHAIEDLSEGPPNQMVWCGGDTVVVAWQRALVMIGPFGASLKYNYNDPIYLISEVDGIRIMTSHVCEFLSKVAPSTASVFKPGSTSPAAILFDSLDHFDKHSGRVADEHIRNIKRKLPDAIAVCIEAAGREYDPRWQERLMRVAAFGKAFLDLYNPEPFVQMSKALRVLNAVRHYKVGIPLTYEQYSAHSPAHLISRLTARSHHLLALRIAEFLNLSPGLVLRHWARNLILSAPKATEFASANTSHGICQKIVSNLEGRHSVSPADIAEIAWSLGKSQLSVELLQYEKKPAKQIPLLMKMERGGEALNQSIKSLDPDLIHAVLWEIRARKSLAEFLSAVEGKLEAVSAIRVWAKASVERNFSSLEDTAKTANFSVGPDWELYRDFCYQDDRRAESACLLLEESYMNSCPPEPYTAVTSPDWEIFFSDKIAKIKNSIQFFAEDSARVFEQKMANESIKLLNIQKNLVMDVLRSYSSGGDLSERPNEQMKKSFLDSITSNNGFTLPSLNETIRQCIKLGLRKQADRLKVDFKVPDKRFWYVKMKALIELRDWKSLEAWAGNKSPIGFEPFVKHLLLMGYHREALRYVPKCDPRNKVELYVKCGEWITAGEECADRGETAKLIELRQRCPSPHVAAALSKMIDELAA
ncbi:Vps16, N-terminal region-domain-containing protein [Phakopsora pachyrhizi]|nr:Vps16, N-terminal region-domain-containing protein [Phakopsora pachyrhizi]